MAINFIKINNTCNECPYLKRPAYDLGEADQYYTCNLSYANTYNLEHFNEICPMKTIKQILIDFVCFSLIAKGEKEFNFTTEKKIIQSFIEEKL